MLRQGLDPCRYPRLEYSLTRNTFQGIKNENRRYKQNRRLSSGSTKKIQPLFANHNQSWFNPLRRQTRLRSSKMENF